jgi:hypothetical protein
MKVFTGKVMSQLCIGLVIGASLMVAPAFAQTPSSQEPTTAPQKPKMESVTINGKVKSASAAALVVVDDQNAEQTIAIDAKTKIMKGGKAATAADLKSDDAVSIVAVKGEGGALIATSVTVGTM